jgi:hypothetical protein
VAEHEETAKYIPSVIPSVILFVINMMNNIDSLPTILLMELPIE